MKKYGIVLIGLLVIGIGVFAFTKTGKAPETPAPSEGATTTPSQAGPTQGASAPAVPQPHDPSVGLSAQAKVDNPDWKISLKFDPAWTVSALAGTLFITSSTATFTVNEDTPISEPELVTFSTENRTIAGQPVQVRVYKNPNETYALYEFFELTLGNDTYYFKAKTTETGDADLPEFYAGISVK